MKKLLLLFLLAPIFLSCSDDEVGVDSSMWFLARKAISGENTITGTFCVFKAGDYDPASFKYSFNPQTAWESAEIKTINGETVKSSYINIVLKGDSHGIYKCNTGEYFVVCVIASNNHQGDIWKAKKIIVEKNKATIVEPIFKDTYTLGYIEWEE